jgi:hypothetical protein
MKLDIAAFEKWETWGKMIHDDLCHSSTVTVLLQTL